jgi:phage N-6-adenine-methyltransferase
MSLIGFQAQNHRQQVGRRGALDKVDDRRTPRETFDLLNAEFEFTLDAAASVDNALTDHFYDLDSDGLASPWYDHNVWVNPPYSDLRPWVEKASLEMSKPDGPGVVVMLLPANRTEQGWWQDVIEPGRREGRIEVRFCRGRLRFDTPDHDYTKQPKGNRPPFGVCLVIWRKS